MRQREPPALERQDVDLENFCLGVGREAAHALADRGHNPGTLGAEHVGKRRPDTEHLARPPITVNHSSMRVWTCSPATAPPGRTYRSATSISPSDSSVPIRAT